MAKHVERPALSALPAAGSGQSSALSRLPPACTTIFGRAPLVIGIAGLLVLTFVIVVMYQVVRNEDAANEEVPAEEVKKAPGDEPFPAPAPDPPKASKKPPLNEK